MSHEQELRQAAEAWAAAIVANDADAIGRFMTDDWVMVSQDGISRREQFLGLVASGALTHSAMDMVPGTDRIRLMGGWALFTARVTNVARFEGRDYPADEWTTDVFVRTAGGWKCAHTQITPAK